jgi:hypothetical protein
LEDLAKSGYKPAIKYKSLTILLYVWLHNENQIYKSGDFYSFLSPQLLATKNLQIHFLFQFLIFNFSFWQNFISKENTCWQSSMRGISQIWLQFRDETFF